MYRLNYPAAEREPVSTGWLKDGGDGVDAPLARNSPLFLRDATTFTAEGSRFALHFLRPESVSSLE